MESENGKSVGASPEFVNGLSACQPVLFSYISILMGGDTENAKDVLQEANLYIWNHRDTYDATKSSFLTWVKTLASIQVLKARNKVLREKARTVYAEDVYELVASRLAEESAPPNNRIYALRECLKKLTARDRRILDLHYGRREKLEDLAREFRMTLASVKMKLLRLRGALGECILDKLCRLSRGEDELPDTLPDFDSAIIDLLDTGMARDWSRFNAVLRSSPERLRDCIRQMDVHALLSYDAAQREIASVRRGNALRRFCKSAGIPALSAAALLVILLGGRLFLRAVGTPASKQIAENASKMATPVVSQRQLLATIGKKAVDNSVQETKHTSKMPPPAVSSRPFTQVVLAGEFPTPRFFTNAVTQLSKKQENEMKTAISGKIATLAVTGAVAAASLAGATDVCLSQPDGANESSFNSAGHWNYGDGVQAIAPTAGYTYWVTNGLTLRTPQSTSGDLTFGGDSLVVSNAVLSLRHANCTMSGNFRLYGAEVRSDNGISSLGGTITVYKTDTPVKLLGSAYRRLWMNGTLQGDGDIYIGPDCMDAIGQFNAGLGRTTANAKNFTGRFIVENTEKMEVWFDMASATFLQSKREGNSPLATFINSPYFFARVSMDIPPWASIAVTNGVRLVAENNTTLQINSSISGTGNLKIGHDTQVKNGVVVLNGPVTGMDSIQATLNHLTLGTNFCSTVPVTVAQDRILSIAATNGIIAQMNGTLIPVADATVDSLNWGASGQFGLIFNGTNTSCLHVRGNLVREDSSRPITIIIQNTITNGLAQNTRILSAANLSSFSASDFTLRQVDSCMNLMTGDLSIVSEPEGWFLEYTQAVEIVHLIKSDDSNLTNSFNTGINWSDRLPPSADKNYFINNADKMRCYQASNHLFQGASLSVCNGGCFSSIMADPSFRDLRLGYNSMIMTGGDNMTMSLGGIVTVTAPATNPALLAGESMCSSLSDARVLNLCGIIRGDGDLRCIYKKSSTDQYIYPFRILLTGDASAFTGGVQLWESRAYLEIANEASLGGPAAAFRADRLSFASNGTLRATASLVMSDATRGITLASSGLAGTLNVLTATDTLTVSNAITGVGGLCKDGPGTLTLSGWNSFTGGMLLTNGTLICTSSNALGTSSLTFNTNTVLKITSAEGVVLGGTQPLVPLVAGGTLTVDIAAPASIPSAYEKNLFILPDTKTFDSSLISLKGISATRKNRIGTRVYGTGVQVFLRSSQRGTVVYLM